MRYLAMLPNLVRYDIVHPQKAVVLRALASALDDPKKSVRREAVEARYDLSIFHPIQECIAERGAIYVCCCATEQTGESQEWVVRKKEGRRC